ncbi:MAG: excinuclease ABC subunit UvrC [Alphaproteobacteria bacterium]|nr:excinuclease ABC subunit UvrC [Alphaproteobacteria bacterium]
MKKKTGSDKRGTEARFSLGAAMLRVQIKTLPTSPGVYRMMGTDGEPLYVGKAKNLKRRVSSYTQRARLPVRLQRMVSLARGLEITVTRTEAEALLLEANYIQRFMPPFNILLRDDKSYPSILITRDHDFPRLSKHRGMRKQKGWYFGPFASGTAVTETLQDLQRGFMLRTCSDADFSRRQRPCLQYHIKRCTAPCVGRVDHEAYARQVADALDFLKGKNASVQKKLAMAMQRASESLDYEKAAQFRDRIKSLSAIQSSQIVYVPGLHDADVLALHQAGGKTVVQAFFFRMGRNYGARLFYPKHDRDQKPAEIMAAFLAQFYADKEAPPLILVDTMPAQSALLAEALSARLAEGRVSIVVPRQGARKRLIEMARRNAEEALARHLSEKKTQAFLLRRVGEIFGLSNPPSRIEVYDNAHIAGAFPVGAMIAAGEEGFLKKTYRTFTIRAASPDDDFAMMEEVLTRRFKRLTDEDPDRASSLWPDLVLIDGGAGQVSRARAVLDACGCANIAVVGIAKGPQRNAGRERFFVPGRTPFSLDPDDPVLYYLQRLRDEAHRFANGAHKGKRTRALSQSRLDDVPGVGSLRKKALLNHFGSAKAVAEADVDDLVRVPGISHAVARKIRDYFDA